MEYTDTYKTIDIPSEGLYKEKGSKFIAYAFPVSNEDQIREIIATLKKEHHSAKHHCYAWQLGEDHRSFRFNDDGEPSGTAGRPIFGQIQQSGLTDIVVIVVRYFGGTLLGTSGLANAYKQAAAEVLDNASVIEKIVETTIDVHFDYQAMNDFMKVIKEFQIEIKEGNFNLACEVKLSVRKRLIALVMEKLGKVRKLRAQIIVERP